MLDLIRSPRTPFVVIDVETTGFTHQDRIVEISAITLDPRTLATVEEYDTLVNPGRDVSAQVTAIHGLTASILEAAPSFKEIVPALAKRLNSAFIVAHLPICTMKLCANRSLKESCDYHGIALEDAHRSLVDARATAELFRQLAISAVRDGSLFKTHGVARCAVQDGGDVVIRTLRRENTELRTKLTRIAKSPWQDPLRDYRYAVNLAFDDGEITEKDWLELDTLRSTLGLKVAEANEQHQILFDRAREATDRDQYMSPSEKRLLSDLARALKLDFDSSEMDSDEAPTRIEPGWAVCFTGNGQGMLERSEMTDLANEYGLIVKSGVSKKLDVLVAADVSSMSGKTRKARELGVPVISAVDFLNMIGTNKQA